MTVSKIQVRKGNLADLPILDAGELGYATDKKRLFIGNVAPATITANGSDVDFSFGVDLDNLRGVDGVPYLVTVDDADASGQYTITNSGSTITFGSAPANNAVIKLQYNTELLTYIPDRGDDNVTSVSLDTTGGAVTNENIAAITVDTSTHNNIVIDYSLKGTNVGPRIGKISIGIQDSDFVIDDYFTAKTHATSGTPVVSDHHFGGTIAGGYFILNYTTALTEEVTLTFQNTNWLGA